MRNEDFIKGALLGFTAVGIATLAHQQLKPIDLEQAAQPINPNFATLPYEKGFNIRRIDRAIRRKKPLKERLKFWEAEIKYLVVFRSVLHEGVAGTEREEVLINRNSEAFEEAKDGGGLVVYQQGNPNEKGENLSSCIWDTALQAYIGAHGPAHLRAAKISHDTYKSHAVDLYTYESKFTLLGRKVTLNSVPKNPAAHQFAHAA